MDKVIGREQYGSQNVRKNFVKKRDGSLVTVDDSFKFTSVSQFFRSVFLPQGYPESVSSDYLEYQLWDTVQAFSSSITGTLATQAVLQGVGVGDDSATVLAATITWLMKNGTGMIGQILFAWFQGAFLDCDCKRWRLFADILNDFAIFLEILAPIFDIYFRLIICIAGVCKSIVGVAGGATRAALTQHQARRNNMADVSAKDGSQETLVNLAALLCSLVLMPLVTGKQGVIWLLYLFFTGLHLFANFRAVTSVVMETFNQARLHIVVKHYISSPEAYVLSPKAANLREPVLWSTRRKLTIKLGTSLTSVVESWESFDKLMSLYANSNYLLSVDLKRRVTSIALHENSSYIDQLQACYQAELLEYAICQVDDKINKSKSHSIHEDNIIEAFRHGDTLSATAHSWKLTQAGFSDFLEMAHDQGWVSGQVLLGADEWRAMWSQSGIEDKKTF